MTRAHTHAPHLPADVVSIRAGGRRVTRQRALIWDVFLRSGDRHLSAREVATALPELHQATVYRALDVLVAEGLLRRTEIEGRALYEIAAEHLHHHVVCTSCGEVRHVHDEAVRGALRRVEHESGYVLADEELAFRGLCPACAATSRPA
ncbi:MAG TPA: Fur family transcriptional regulator [Gaiellaceae bacterium]